MDIKKIKNANTKIIGKNIEFFYEIDSTNLYAQKVIDISNMKVEREGNSKKSQENLKINGKLIIADVQTRGQGTKGRIWYTGENKNIAMSIILIPNCDIEDLKGFTVKVAKIIQMAIYELYKIKLVIKEPNDLLLNQKKICGILTKANTIGTKVNYIIIGIGINVNEETFDDDTKNIATSLKKEYKKEFSREDIIIKIIELLEKEIDF